MISGQEMEEVYSYNPGAHMGPASKLLMTYNINSWATKNRQQTSNYKNSTPTYFSSFHIHTLTCGRNE